ncbi:MAG: hypothetical protein Q8O19_01155, partial [Rectinemataceae bacterium]|nr:hypothetical protein [Rectinemataceae bacterium]
MVLFLLQISLQCVVEVLVGTNQVKIDSQRCNTFLAHSFFPAWRPVGYQILLPIETKLKNPDAREIATLYFAQFR